MKNHTTAASRMLLGLPFYLILFLTGGIAKGQLVVTDLFEEYKISNVNHVASNGEQLLLAATPRVKEKMLAGVYTIDSNSGAISLLTHTAERPRSSKNSMPLSVQGFALASDNTYLQTLGLFELGAGWEHQAFVGRGKELFGELKVPQKLEKIRGYIPVGSYTTGNSQFATVGFTYNLDDSPYGDIVVEGISNGGKSSWRQTIGIKGKGKYLRCAVGSPMGVYVGFGLSGEATAVRYDNQGEVGLAYRTDKYTTVSRIVHTDEWVYFAGNNDKDDRLVIEQTDLDGMVQWTASFDDAAGKPDRLYDLAANEKTVAVLYGTKAQKGYNLVVARLDVATGEVLHKQTVSTTSKETFKASLLPYNFLRLVGDRLVGVFCVKDKVVSGAAHLHLVELDEELQVINEQRILGTKAARNSPSRVVVHGKDLYILSHLITGFGVPNFQNRNNARFYRVQF